MEASANSLREALKKLIDEESSFLPKIVWRSLLVSPGQKLEGTPSQVAVGVVVINDLPYMAFQTGDQEPVLISTRAARELQTNISRSLTIRAEFEGLSDD